jgi:hypothetical protein
MAVPCCSVAEHPEQAAIHTALDAGESLRSVEASFGVPRSTLSRHQQHRETASTLTMPPGDDLSEEMSMSTIPPMAQRTRPAVLPAPSQEAIQHPVSETANPEPAPLPAAGPLLTVDEAQSALDQVRQERAQLPAKKRDLQQQLYALRGQLVDLERRVDREPGLDAPLAEARRSLATLDHYYHDDFPTEEQALKAREQAAEAALRQAEIAVALEQYNTLALQRPALWEQLSTQLDHLGATIRALLTLTQQQRDLAATAGFEFPAGQSNPNRLIATVIYGHLSRVVATPPSLQEARLPLRPYADHDKAADLVDHGTAQQAPPMVWVQLADRQRSIAYVTEDLPFTGAEIRDLEMSKAVRIDQTTWHTLRRKQQVAERLMLVPEPTWT